jgi:hypothetical protein
MAFVGEHFANDPGAGLLRYRADVCHVIPLTLWSGRVHRSPVALPMRVAVPDIFDEVQEDLRAERARRLLTRYGGVLVAALVLVIAGVGAWQGWKYYDTKDNARVADAYLAALRPIDAAAGAPDAAVRQQVAGALAQVATEATPGYRTLARLQQAALKADTGDLPGALALWDQVSRDNAADHLLRDLATLQWAMHQVDSGDPAQVNGTLATLTAPENPLHALALEAQALLALRQDHKDAARDIFKRLAQDVTAPEGVRGRANGLLIQIGG